MYMDMIEELQKVDMAFLSLKSTSMLLDTRHGKESLPEEAKCFLHFDSKLTAMLLSKSAILFLVLLTTATMLEVDLFLPSTAAGLMLEENNTLLTILSQGVLMVEGLDVWTGTRNFIRELGHPEVTRSKAMLPQVTPLCGKDQ